MSKDRSSYDERHPAPHTFDVTTTTTHTFKEGWGVHMEAIWAWDDDEDGEPSHVEDIYGMVVRIDAPSVYLIGNVPCVKVEHNSWVPVTNFLDTEDLGYDDTHDLRSRWFATKAEADEHLAYTLNRWKNPSPWESFVKV